MLRCSVDNNQQYHVFVFAGTSDKNTSPLRMEYSQAGFSAHASKVSHWVKGTLRVLSCQPRKMQRTILVLLRMDELK